MEPVPVIKRTDVIVFTRDCIETRKREGVDFRQRTSYISLRSFEQSSTVRRQVLWSD